MIRSFRPAGLALLLAAAACAWGPRRSATDEATISACRQAADRAYTKQNRAEIYETDRYTTSGRDAPYSVETSPGVTTRGLSGAFERDNMTTDCLNASGVSDNTAGSLGSAPSAVPPPQSHP